MGTLAKFGQSTGKTRLVFGELSSGKSSAILNRLLNEPQALSVLWAAFDNTSALEEMAETETTKLWQVGLFSDWKSFDEEVLKPVKRGELKTDVVVLDGLHVMGQFCLAAMSKGARPTQEDWATMGTTVRDAIIQLRDRTGSLYATVAVLPDETGSLQIAMNRDFHNKVFPIFGRKMYTHTAPKKDANGNVIGLEYKIQENPTLAFKLRPVSK